MTTKLSAPLRREFAIGKTLHILTIDPDGFKLVVKGKRKGVEIAWRDLVSGEAAMAVALRASLGLPGERAQKPQSSKAETRARRSK
jgi:hypothetical protein